MSTLKSEICEAFKELLCACKISVNVEFIAQLSNESVYASRATEKMMKTKD